LKTTSSVIVQSGTQGKVPIRAGFESHRLEASHRRILSAAIGLNRFLRKALENRKERFENGGEEGDDMASLALIADMKNQKRKFSIQGESSRLVQTPTGWNKGLY